MSKKKYNYKYKKKYNNKVHNSIIHGSTLYIYNNHNEGKRKDKRSCAYYDCNSEKCKNDKCHVNICTSAAGCSVYKKKDKIIKNSLSEYDETYVERPAQSGIHDNKYVHRMSKNIGTNVHEEYIKSDGVRRHKARCVYYDKVKKMCKYLFAKCCGSSHCKRYKE